MVKWCKLTITDEVNACLTGVDDKVHKALKNMMKRFVPSARHQPSFKLGRWDGYVDFYKQGWTFVNLIDEAFLKVIERHGYQINFIDNRVPFPHDLKPVTVDEFSDCISVKSGKPIILHDYQAYSINQALEFSSGIFEMATGSGKSYVCGGIAKLYGSMGKVMVIVPSIDLVTQTGAAFLELGVDVVGQFYGKEKIVENITISTWQSLINYPEILDGVICLIADECHEYKAHEVHELLTVVAKDVPYRFGFTATLPKPDVDRMKLLSSLGPVLFEKKAWELQRDGVLAKCHVTCLQYQDDEELDFGLDFAAEAKYIANHPKRLRHLGSFIQEIAATGNTLILVKNIATGEKLQKEIEGSIFISGSASSKKRKNEYDNIQNSDNVPLIATYGIASTGIDIPRLYNVFLFEPGKDYQTILQSIGRGLRKAKDKDYVDLFDISSTLKYSKKQLTARKKMYRDAKYPFTLVPVYFE
jgi:superfamily II DNA or RNA helicase